MRGNKLEGRARVRGTGNVVEEVVLLASLLIVDDGVAVRKGAALNVLGGE